MKPPLMILMLLQCFLQIDAQDSLEEPEFFMGSSIKSDKRKTINSANLVKNLPTRAILGLKVDNDKRYGRYGVDISHHQGEINWKKFHADSIPNKVAFIIVKATQGATRVDKKFSANFDTAKRRGYLVGAYHFYSQTVSPELQADNFIRTVTLSTGDIMPVLDIERNCYNDCANTPDLLIPKDSLVRNLKIFIAKLEQHYVTKVIIYTSESFYKDYLKPHFKGEFFWIARYSKTPPPCFPIGQTDTLSNTCFVNEKKICWQYSQGGSMKGANAAVDLNFLHTYYLSKWLIN